MRRALAAGALAAVAASALIVGLKTGSAAGGGEEAAATTGPRSSATVARRDLVERETLDGTLGYSGSRTVANGLDGTLTRLPSEGQEVGRGQSLYEVDGRPSAFLLYGRRPAWRAFEAGMSAGEDVRQLEQSLAALGFDPGVVDDEFTDSTEGAIAAFQEARGIAEDGSLELGEIVFLPGRARIASRKGATGMRLRPGQEILGTTSTKRVVTVQLPASRGALVARGDGVRVELPGGRTVRGRITKVSRVAKPPAEEGGEATLEVTIVLRGRAERGLDQAPVTVGITRDARRNALSVPVTALLALEGGRTGVELPGGRVVRVETGLFADGYVEVSGRGIRTGTKVVIPDEL